MQHSTETTDAPCRPVPPPEAGWGWRDAVVTLAILALLLLLLRDGLFSSRWGIGDPAGDGRTQFYPWRIFGFGEWRQRGLPLWNPYVLLGMPFVANLQSAMFYPANVLGLVMPVHCASNWGILINLFLSALFTYLLARLLGISRPGACAAALTYTLAANHVLRIYQGHWSHLAAMPWLPFLLLCTEGLVRKGRAIHTLLGGCGLALQIFSGQPQLMYYTCIFASMYFLLRLFAFGERPRAWKDRARRLGLFAAVFALGVALAAIQMAPAWELMRESSRAERLTYSWVSQYALPPENLATLLVPDLFGPAFKEGVEQLPYWGRRNFWETGVYMGVVSFLLAVGALLAADRRRWLPFAVPGLFFLLLALGPCFPLLRLLYRIVPGFDVFRAPARAVSVAGLSVAMLAGMGLDVALMREPGPARRRRRLQWLAVGLAGFLLALTLIVQTSRRWAPEGWGRFVHACVLQEERPYLYVRRPLSEGFVAKAWDVCRSSLLRSAAFVCGAAILVAGPFGRRRALPWIAAAIVLLMAGDFYTFGRRFIVTFDPADRVWDEATRASLQRLHEREPFRVRNAADWPRYPCDPMMYHVSSLEGVEPNVPRRFHDFFWTTQGQALSLQRTSYHLRREDSLLDLVNLQYEVLPVEFAAPGDAGKSGQVLRIERRPAAMPRAFLVHNFLVARDREDALARLPTLDFRRFVLLEEQPREPCAPAAGEEAAPSFLRYDPGGAVIRVSARSAGFLVLSDLFYPGWVARLDGRLVKIYRADYLLRAVGVPPGEHVVEFEYACPSFGFGAAVSVAAGGLVICCFYYLLWATLSERRRSRER